MKNKIIFIVAIIIMLAGSAVYAQKQTVKVNVPFDFQAQGKVFSAGEYLLSPRDNQKAGWLINGQSSKDSKAYFLASTVENVDEKSQSKLIFRKYADRYFLAGFTVFGFNIELIQTKEEKMLRRELTAENESVKAEIVTIAVTQ